jgi:4-amino-4-deoxy-L-arabinose transferase-like glycosyltransferase
MLKNRLLSLAKNNAFLLSLILMTFLVKGLFMAAILPIFQAPDELIHYFRVQYNSQQETGKPAMDENKDASYSEEILETEKIVRSKEIAGNSRKISDFSESYSGKEEKKLLNNNWKRYTDIYPRRAPDYPTLYYKVSAGIENFFSGYSILVRFYLIRVFSVLIGLAIVFLFYLISVAIGFSKKISLLIAAILSFQPMFSATAAALNPDILLIFSFTLFTLGGVLILRDGPRWKNIAITLLAVILGILTKGPGLVLAIIAYPLLSYALLKKLNLSLAQSVRYFVIISSILVIVTFFALPGEYLTKITETSRSSHFTSVFASLRAYSSEAKNFMFTGLSYWGNFGSLDAAILKNIVKLIWLVEAISAIGIALIFLAKEKIRPIFRPEKKYLVFLLAIFLSLELAIRFYDWRIFDVTGDVSIGTPGRYFLPAIYSQAALVIAGLGAFLKKNEHFEILLKTILVFMAGLWLYSIFNVIIPRYYL